MSQSLHGAQSRGLVTAGDGYRIEPVEPRPARLREQAALLAHVFPRSGRYSPEYLRWQYAENPSGTAVGFDAYDGESLAAHYVTQPLEAEIFGRVERGLLSFNTATHPGHQGRGLFTRLARATYARARELGFGFVVGVANANSTPGFTGRLGFTLVAPLDVETGFGYVDADPAQRPAFRQLWSRERLAWRLRNPNVRYRLARGRLFAPTHLRGVAMQLTCESYESAPAPSGRQPLLGAWLGLHPSRRRRGVALAIPPSLRPSPLNLIFLDLTSQHRTLQRSDVQFEALDFDAY